jgi:hypothetical protein
VVPALTGLGERWRRLTRSFADPFFLLCLSLVLLNRWVLKAELGHDFGFLRDHLDDLLFFPVGFPSLIAFQRLIGIRPMEGKVGATECAMYGLLWALLFEVVFPRFLGRGIPDGKDVLCYALGLGMFLAFRKRG